MLNMKSTVSLLEQPTHKCSYIRMHTKWHACDSCRMIAINMSRTEHKANEGLLRVTVCNAWHIDASHVAASHA